MGFENHYEGIDEYAVQLIKYKARQLVGRVGFTESDRNDLEQELMLDLLRRLPKYNPDRAQRNTFIARVVEHKIATIIESQKASMRDYRLCRCSLNDRFEDEEGGSIERMETIDQEDYLRRTGRLSRTADELRALTIDVRRAMEQLPPINKFCALGKGIGKRYYRPSPFRKFLISSALFSPRKAAERSNSAMRIAIHFQIPPFFTVLPSSRYRSSSDIRTYLRISTTGTRFPIEV